MKILNDNNIDQMKTYLIKSVKGSYWSGDYDLDPSMYDMGTTYEDYLNDKFIELSDSQLQFHQDNPKASVREVIAMELDPPAPEPLAEEVLQNAKSKKKREIAEYSGTEDVKSYYLDDTRFWIDRDERIQMANDIDIAESKNRTLFDLTTDLTVDTDVAREVLLDIGDYDNACNDIEKSKMDEVEALTTKEEVESYEVKSGWPISLAETQSDIKKRIQIRNGNDVQVAAATFLIATINEPAMLDVTPDNLALKIKALYPIWDKDNTYGDRGLKMGTAVVTGQRFCHKVNQGDEEPTLFQVLSDHVLQATWVPGEGGGTEALYKAVQETHTGTVDDPIPWVYNMVLENGKYYTDGGVKYVCVRDSVNPMPYALADLVSAGYVEVVE